MQILIVNPHVGTPDGSGGTRHYSLARELTRRGHAVTIVTSSFSHMTRKQRWVRAGQSQKQEELDGITFLWLRTPPYRGSAGRIWNMLVFAHKVRRLMARGLISRPDIVIGSSPEPFAALAAERLAKGLGRPFVLEVRDLWPQTLIDLGRISPWHPVVLTMAWVERHLYRNASRIISLLPNAAEHMAAKGADRKRIIWVPNGVNPDLIPALAPPERQPFTVMYAGTHGLSNQLDTLLDAARLLQDRGWGDRIRIRMLGDGPTREGLQDRVAAEGLTMVSMEPPVPKQQMLQLFQEADAFVMTTRNSPLYRWGISPNKLFEYMAAARPVICGCNSPYVPVTEAGAGFTIPAADAEAMAGAIIQLAETPIAERVAMGQRGRRYAEKHHGFRQLGARLEQALLESLREDPGRPASRAEVIS